MSSLAPELERYLHPTSHPLCPAPERDEALRIMTTSVEALARYKTWFNEREKLIELSERDGFRLTHAFEPEAWRDADRDLWESRTNGRHYGGLCVFGGIRSTKTRWATRTLVRSCLAYGSRDPRSPAIRWCMTNTMSNARMTVMVSVWEWLPESMRMMNDPSGRRKNTTVTKIRYTPDGGFADEQLVFPNGSVIKFLPYEADPGGYQGAELGGLVQTFKVWCRRCALAGREPIQPYGDCPQCGAKDEVPIPNIGAALDEDARERWIQTAIDRCSTRSAKVIWSFTTINGVTPAVRSVRGVPTNIETRSAAPDLPSDRILVAGCPPGHVPYRQRTSTPGWRAIYFHTKNNVFGDNYANLAEMYAQQSQPAKLAKLYGWSEDIIARAFPLFSAVNIVDPADLPEHGTNYRFIDPAGSRNDFIIWARKSVGVGDREEYYIYRDWPDRAGYGEWAIPDENNPNNLNGTAGPAQRYCGYGLAEYKTKVILPAEQIAVPPNVSEWVKQHPKALLPEELASELGRFEPDPYRRARIVAAIAVGASLTDLREQIHATYLDPRAAGTGDAAHKGARTLLDHWRSPQRGQNEVEIAPPFPATYAAAGFIVRDGLQAINRLLYWDQGREMVRPYNAPRLWVSSRCEQVIKALTVYVNDTREESVDLSRKAGWKDVIDPLRYLATTTLPIIRADGMTPIVPGGCGY
jgi:hypothetical protein